jgi:hypothetical protein
MPDLVCHNFYPDMFWQYLSSMFLFVSRGEHLPITECSAQNSPRVALWVPQPTPSLDGEPSYMPIIHPYHQKHSRYGASIIRYACYIYQSLFIV